MLGKPPEGGGSSVKQLVSSDGINNTPVQHQRDTEMQEANQDENSYNTSDQNSRSVHTVIGDSTPEKSKVFNLQKASLYSADIYVFIEKTNNQNIGRLHPMYVGHILHKKLQIPNILKIEKVGKNRIKVQLKNIKDANNLVKNELLKSENLKAFIPNNLLSRKGIIRHVDTIFDEKYLFENLLSPNTITEVKRMKRRITIDGEPAFVPRQTVVVTFEGSSLPNYIYLNSVACSVEPYVQRVIQCYKCLRYAHVANQCRSTYNLCINCGKSKDDDHTCRDPQDSYCIFCQNNEHKSISNVCPSYQTQQKIKKQMASSNLTYLEARRAINNSYASIVVSNSFEALDKHNDDNFPPLPTPNKYPTRRQSFSQPSTSKAYTPINSSISQPNPQPQPNKKRKVLSPINIPPLFPFNFGPKNPLPPNPRERNHGEVQDEDFNIQFIDSFYNFFRSVLTDIESFEELKKIDSQYLKDKIINFYTRSLNG